ncbi:MAG TPA: hypothetical protein VHX61_13475 [Rhizomicrobium sp.]|jgi:hypothetical protein|nr:hypothetical protein [Rhizomicrobium sp.]
MRWLLGALLAVALTGALPSFAQEQNGPNAHPEPILEGQSTTPAAPSGGVNQQGIATPTAVPAPPPGPLPPGPPAGDERAAYLSDNALIAGGVAVTAIVVCAIACFSNSSSTTTSTTVVHP